MKRYFNDLSKKNYKNYSLRKYKVGVISALVSSVLIFGLYNDTIEAAEGENKQISSAKVTQSNQSAVQQNKASTAQRNKLGTAVGSILGKGVASVDKNGFVTLSDGTKIPFIGSFSGSPAKPKNNKLSPSQNNKQPTHHQSQHHHLLINNLM